MLSLGLGGKMYVLSSLEAAIAVLNSRSQESEVRSVILLVKDFQLFNFTSLTHNPL
ncbi:hypothetical protein [Mastigocoleus testarum]|uniref:hypothetical protein n=1 Tax=Mastigocoleus testarum TaxID=996925 RepID=UPI001379DD1F|nr:hypothetical protein [Mastigocoleus testarum]